MPVVGVLVDADVGHDDELRHGALHLGDRARYGPVGIEPGRPAVVLRLRKSEEDDRADAARLDRLRLLARGADRVLIDAGHRADRPRRIDRRVEEHRVDEVAR